MLEGARAVTALVLIPGMMCDARLWGRAVESLPIRSLHHGVPTQADSIAGMAADILATAPDRFALAGLSLGGIVAMEILARAPQRVERVALLDTNPFAEAPEVQARRAGQMARARAGDLEGVMRDEMKPNYLASGADPAILDLCMAMALSLGPDVFWKQSIALRDRPDQQAGLAAYRGPALVLMGAQDRLCPRDRHERMHALLTGSRFAVIENAGHLPPLEQPAATRDALLAWLTQT